MEKCFIFIYNTIILFFIQVIWDYETYFPNEEKSIINNWEKFVRFIIPYANENIKNKDSHRRLKKISRVTTAIEKGEALSLTGKKLV